MALLATLEVSNLEMAHVLALGFAAVASWLCAATVLRLYSPCTPRSRLDNIGLIFVAAAGVTFVLWAIEGLFFDGRVLSHLVFGAVLVTTSSLCRMLFTSELTSFDEPVEDVLIVGTGPLGVSTYYRLTDTPAAQRRVVGMLRLRGEPARPPGIDVPVLGEAEDLLRVIAEHPVSEVYLAARVLTHGGQMQQVVSLCERIGMPFAVPVHSLRFERATLLSTSRATDGYLHYLSTSTKPAQYAVKRLIDVVASAAALVVLSPLLLGVALAIKLTSRGPVLFRQVRVGLHGATFNLYKFRSMVVNAEELRSKLMQQNEQTGPVFKIRNDPRITPIGRFIRKYSIDELPQLVNVLRGDMSLVGPRPALPKEVAEYKVWQRRRLSVRPGLTCYWQVGGRNEIGFEAWMRLDLRYVDNWSLGVDLRLIMQTFPVVLGGRGAS